MKARLLAFLLLTATLNAQFFGGGGGGGLVKLRRTILSTSDLRSISGGKVLVPAAGPNKVIVPLQVIIRSWFFGKPFSGGADLRLIWPDNDGGWRNIACRDNNTFFPSDVLNIATVDVESVCGVAPKQRDDLPSQFNNLPVVMVADSDFGDSNSPNAVSITDPGTNWEPGDFFRLAPFMPGVRTIYQVDTVGAGGSLASITQTFSGSGFEVGSTYQADYWHGPATPTRLTVDFLGCNYTVGDALYVDPELPDSSPVVDVLSVDDVTGCGQIGTFAINDGGAGYTVNNFISVDPDCGAGLKVLAVDGGGAVTSLGFYLPVNFHGELCVVGAAQATTGGTGTGLTIDVNTLLTGSIASFAIDSPGLIIEGEFTSGCATCAKNVTQPATFIQNVGATGELTVDGVEDLAETRVVVDTYYTVTTKEPAP